VTRPGWLTGRRNPMLLCAALLGIAALLLPADGLAASALRAGGLLGSLLLLARALRPPAGASHALAVLEREPLGRGGGLALVEVDGRRLLLGWAPAGTTLLLDLTPGARP